VRLHQHAVERGLEVEVAVHDEIGHGGGRLVGAVGDEVQHGDVRVVADAGEQGQWQVGGGAGEFQVVEGLEVQAGTAAPDHHGHVVPPRVELFERGPHFRGGGI